MYVYNQLKVATCLDDVYTSFEPEPLRDDELQLFPLKSGLNLNYEREL